MQEQQQQVQHAQAEAAAARSKADQAGRAAAQAQHQLHQLHDAYRSVCVVSLCQRLMVTLCSLLGVVPVICTDPNGTAHTSAVALLVYMTHCGREPSQHLA